MWPFHCNNAANRSLPNTGGQAARATQDHRRRRGLTLVELLMATAVLSIMAAALGTLAMTVRTSSDYTLRHGVTTQHGRIAIERIERALNQAHASEQFPGFVVFSDTVDGAVFPDTLVVWHPAGDPANPDGLPLKSEVVVFCPEVDQPNRLMELTVPDNHNPVPSLDDTSAWLADLAVLKTTSIGERTVLTGRLRTAAVVDGAPGDTSLRGAVRFSQLIRPSESQWAEYQAGDIAWDDLPWPQNVFGSATGLRQSWCRIELQLTTDPDASSDAPAEVVPFFGSAAVYYELHK